MLANPNHNASARAVLAHILAEFPPVQKSKTVRNLSKQLFEHRGGVQQNRAQPLVLVHEEI